MIFIADPQLVDPHTYPGRPWPLSSFTERYTDLYMSRNFRLINAHLDPDSVIFLGDLFDGGREWAPDKARKLKTSQRKRLEDLNIHPKPDEQKKKRDLESYKAAVDKDGLNIISKEEEKVEPSAEELRAFIPGENGKWSRWSGKQWGKDLERFSKIFFAPEQLYPGSERQLFAAFDVPSDPTSVENGANNVTSQEYATSGGKSRQVIASLPGNHDLGFGAGVQIVVRERFQSHFGDGNRIDIIGNHTFISLDTPSLSAHSQYQSNGFESEAEQFLPMKHIWKPSMEFMNNLRHPAGKAVSDALGKYYPQDHKSQVWAHEVTDPRDHNKLPSTNKLVQEALKPKPQLPVILLSHVPLFRNRDSECGPLREKGHAISVAFGYQYQNVLTQTLSRDIVTKVSQVGEIVGVFSGDDHDFCDMPHKYNVPIGEAYTPVDSLRTRMSRIREITVKSFSWAMGVRKPGFLLVSLWNPVDARGETVGTPLPTIQSNLCLLPDQLNIFISYGLLFALTMPILLVRAVFVALKSEDSAGLEDMPLTPTRMTLPRFETNMDGTANGYAKPASKGHERSSSTSTSSHNSSANNHLSVQRNQNARTRSVSPAYGQSHNAGFSSQQPTGTLIDKAGFFPQVKWTDPTDEDSDEESNLGGDGNYIEDSQAKWKWRRRTPGPARKVLDEFGMSLIVVGLPGVLWYFYLIKNG